MLRNLLEKMSLTDFLEHSEIPAYIVDEHRNIVFWNQAATKLTGYTEDEVIGKTCANQVLNHVDRNHALVCTTELCPLYQVIKKGVAVQVPFAVYGLTKSGYRKPFSVFGIPVKINEQTVGGLELFTDAEKMDNDLALAVKIQDSFVPSDNETAEFFYKPSATLSGDMIYCRLPWLGLLDVSGHGISSALFGMLVRTLLDMILNEDPPLNLLPSLLEGYLERYQLEDMYLTTIFGKIENGFYRFINAGHPSPIDLSKPCAIQTKRVYPIGCGLSKEYGEEVVNSFDLSKGPLLIYSDGLIEVKTKEGFLGEDGLMQIVKPDSRPLQIYSMVLSLARTLLHEDDITIILLKKSGTVDLQK